MFERTQFAQSHHEKMTELELKLLYPTMKEGHHLRVCVCVCVCVTNQNLNILTRKPNIIFLIN